MDRLSVAAIADARAEDSHEENNALPTMLAIEANDRRDGPGLGKAAWASST